MKKVLPSLLMLVLACILFHGKLVAQNYVNWIGGVSTDYFNANNWSDNTMNFAVMNNNYLTIGAGSPNNCLLVGGNSSNVAYRPGKLNVTAAGVFTCSGAVYPNNSDSLNGNITINSSGDFNDRNILYIGNKANCNLTINGGKLSSKNATYIAAGTGGTATVTLNGGNLFAGGGGANMDLSIANATGLTAQLNIYGGAVTVGRNLLIGTGGHIHITGIGYLKVLGDKVAQMNGLMAGGQLTCTAGKTLVATYDGTNTTVQIPQNSNSMIVEYPDSVVLRTTNLVCAIEKNTGNVLSYRYKGVETVANKPTDTHQYMYHDFTTSYGFETVWGCTYEIVQDSTEFAHIVFKRPYTPSIGHVTPVDCELHYALKKDDRAIYVYSKLEHKPNYPAFDIGSWRQVWWIAYNNSGVNLCERIYTDSLRSWQMPSNYDYTTAVGSGGPQEIVKLTTGVRAGKFDGKYEYSLRFWDYPVWGHASNINSIGSWCVNASCEYYNEGPMHHDLNAAAGIIHQCMNGVHYGDLGMVSDTLTSWKKVYGPYLLLITDKSTGDSNWMAAKERQVLEKAQWPYTWVKDSAAYPPASLRGSITGKYVVSDVLKTGYTGSGAWIGVTSLADGATNFQFESKDYQYWVKTDASGNFTIPNVRPGTYSLFAFVDGAVGEYRQDNVTVTAGGTNNLGTITRTIDRSYGRLVWEIGTPNRMSNEFKLGDFDYCEGNIQNKFRDTFPATIEYSVAARNWKDKLPYAHTKYPDAATIPNPVDAWKWRLNFVLPAGFPTSGNARLTIAYASNDHAQQWIYVNNESSLFTSYYPNNGDGNAFIRQANYAKYSYSQVLIPMNKFVVGNNVITLVMPSNSGWVSHLMYDYISLEANVPALPVEFASFTATANAGKALLKWTTATEINNDHFDIERSKDGIVFEQIGTVKSMGSPSSASAYSFTDALPFLKNNYYRLKQVDKDGKFDYSATRLVKFDGRDMVSIYPSPAKDHITIQNLTGRPIKQISIYTAEGKLLYGNSAVNVDTYWVDVSAFAVGLYIVKVSDGEKSSSSKFSKN